MTICDTEAGDSEECPFRVGFVMEDYIHYFGDLTSLVGGAVHVIHQYGVRDALGANTFYIDKVLIYEVACSSGVQECLDGMHLAGVYGADFYQKDNRRPAVMLYKRLGKISDNLHPNNQNNQLERRAQPP